jgi:hypothetical protein
MNNEITRNMIRNEILPLFESVHPEHKKNVSKLLDYFSELKDNIDTQVQDFLP